MHDTVVYYLGMIVDHWNGFRNVGFVSTSICYKGTNSNGVDSLLLGKTS
jgi:hypothetical protein